MHPNFFITAVYRTRKVKGENKERKQTLSGKMSFCLIIFPNKMFIFVRDSERIEALPFHFLLK